MKKRFFIALFGIVMAAFAVQSLCAGSQYKVVGGPDKFYYGHISLTDVQNDGQDPVVWRQGQTAPEVAVLNLPLGPGDVIQTSDGRRCEIQFDSGTIVRLDFATELKIETILARSLSSARNVSNLLLGHGRLYIMYKEYDDSEIFQVMTPNAAIKLSHNSVSMISSMEDGAADIQVKSGKAQALIGQNADRTKKIEIKKLQRLIVQKDHQHQIADYISGTDFEGWNDGINKNFEAFHEGLSTLPKPVQNLPKAVVNFANFHTQYGEWLWDDMYGYVWRPYYNDVYPWGTWAPYIYGRWGTMNNQLYWIPGEPWGWVPYHLGIWQWDKKKGWIWLPGSMFAPAWAVWDFYFGYYCWRPFSLWDWYYFGLNPYYYLTGYGFYNQWGNWQYNWPYTWTSDYWGQWDSSYKPPLTKITKGQLKKPGSGTLPLPKEIKGAYNAAVAALKKGDAGAIESIKHVPRTLVFVQEKELNTARIHEKALNWDSVPKQSMRPGEDGLYRTRGMLERNALGSFRTLEGTKKSDSLMKSRLSAPGGEGIEASVGVPLGQAGTLTRSEEGVAGRSRGAVRVPSAPSPVRFRDWNPDVRVAERLGVRISYSSRTNEVQCPQLRMTSRDAIQSRMRMTSEGVYQGSWGGFSSGPGNNSTSSVDSGTATPSSHNAQASRREEGTSGGKAKKD